MTEAVVHGKPQPNYTEINADTSPLDLLYDVQQVIMNVCNPLFQLFQINPSNLTCLLQAHPIRLAFEKLWQAVGVMDATKDQAEVHWMQWQWHAVQAQIWRAAGMSICPPFISAMSPSPFQAYPVSVPRTNAWF